MKVLFFTIVLDGMPWIENIYESLRRVEDIEWEWWVVEGVAKPVGCTDWVAKEKPRLSRDGTHFFLAEVAGDDPRVCVVSKAAWEGKVQMVNVPIKNLTEPCLVWQMDSDELWTPDQIREVRMMFMANPTRDCAYFWCDYFVGPDIVITSRDTYGNNSSYEWLRVWRFAPGQRFTSHEPPRLSGSQLRPFTHAETEARGLVFDHWAYATENQVQFKEAYYGSRNNKAGHLYKDAVKNWRRLQENTKWPVKDLSKFLPWVGPGVTADRVER